MREKVCMFVWNHFTNDARVLRECTALSENNYDVDLICIDDPNDPLVKTYEEINPHFRVHRVRRYPVILEMVQRVLRVMKRNPIIALLSIILVLTAGYFFPIITIPVVLLGLLTLVGKVRTLIIRASIILRMIRMGRKGDYAIYHSNDLNTLPQGYISAKWRFKKRKIIYDSHEVQTSRTGYDSKFYGIQERFLLKSVDAMMVENHTRAAYNEKIYGFYPYVLHNYPFKSIRQQNPDRHFIHRKLGLPEDEKILLYQGGIQAGRGLEKLIQAMPLINEGRLVFVGDGRIKNKLIARVKEMELEDKVTFIPKVPLHELPLYTNSAYLGFQVLNNINFNHYSASSNKLYEYMMSNVPVIACSFPEIKKVVESAKVGLCVDSHDAQSIADGVNHLLAHEEVRDKMSRNCTAASDIYNWENEKKYLIECYEHVKSSGKTSSTIRRAG